MSTTGYLGMMMVASLPFAFAAIHCGLHLRSEGYAVGAVLPFVGVGVFAMSMLLLLMLGRN